MALSKEELNARLQKTYDWACSQLSDAEKQRIDAQSQRIEEIESRLRAIQSSEAELSSPMPFEPDLFKV